MIFLNVQVYRTCGDDPSLDTIVGLLSIGHYPNVCIHKEKRKVLTTESRAALIHKSSVNCASKFRDVQFPLPFFVFSEKIRTKAVSCKTMTNVTPLHLILFGSKKVQVLQESAGSNYLVRLDNWITLQMDPLVVAKILTLRPALDRLIFDVSANPEMVANLHPPNNPLIQIVDRLCHFKAADFRPPAPTDESQSPMGLEPPANRVSLDASTQLSKPEITSEYWLFVREPSDRTKRLEKLGTDTNVAAIRFSIRAHQLRMDKSAISIPAHRLFITGKDLEHRSLQHSTLHLGEDTTKATAIIDRLILVAVRTVHVDSVNIADTIQVRFQFISLSVPFLWHKTVVCCVQAMDISPRPIIDRWARSISNTSDSSRLVHVITFLSRRQSWTCTHNNVPSIPCPINLKKKIVLPYLCNDYSHSVQK